MSKILYTARAHTSGGRNGEGKTDDGKLAVTLGVPKEMGGNGNGTNPEQLFAVGYAACFIGAMQAVAAKTKQKLPADLSIDSEVGLLAHDDGRYTISATLNVRLPGMDETAANALVQTAHQVCPYSNATRGNVDVVLTVSV